MSLYCTSLPGREGKQARETGLESKLVLIQPSISSLPLHICVMTGQNLALGNEITVMLKHVNDREQGAPQYLAGHLSWPDQLSEPQLTVVIICV